MSIFPRVKSAAIARAVDLLPRWFPQGKWSKGKFYVGDYTGREGDSANYDLSRKLFIDFAENEKPCDIIDWYARAFTNGDQMEACLAIAKEVGVPTNGETPEFREETSKKPKDTKPTEEWKSFSPSESDPDPIFPKHDGRYIYRSHDGFPVRYVLRVNLPTIAGKKQKKKFIPFTFGALNGKTGWHQKHPNVPMSLYGLERLDDMPDAAVVVCEGEKAADAAAKHFRNNPCISWSMGCQAVLDHNWQVLSGRRVVIWPDKDKPGLEAAAKLAEFLKSIASRVAVLDVSDPEILSGQDAADLTLDKPLEWLQAHLPAEVSSEGMAQQPLRTSSKQEIGRPVVQFSGPRIDLTADAIEEALLLTRAPIYQRFGTLQRPGVQVVPGRRGAPVLTASLSPLAPPGVVDMIAGGCDLLRYDAREKVWVGMKPSNELAGVVLSRVGRWKLNSIAGVITTPTLRPDGSILSHPGYDEATRLFYFADPSLRLDPSRLQVGRSAAVAALATLEGLISGFPFKTAVCRSVAISGIITPVVRAMMPVAPLHAFRATAPGSGKSFFADVISSIASGRGCPVMSATLDHPEETDKRLTGLLLLGCPIISIDNLNGDFTGALICQAASQGTLQLRPLGSSEMREVDNRATILANGNNMRVTGDLVRRTVVCHLDAEMENPETRKFSFNPVDAVQSDRAKYVGACLTIVRSWLASDEAEGGLGLEPMGGFEEWSDTVRSALVWLGMEDPKLSQEEAKAEDTGASDLAHFLRLVGDLMQTGPNSRWTVRKLLDEADLHHSDGNGFVHSELREVLFRIAGVRNEISGRSLGKWLSALAGRVASGRRVVKYRTAVSGSDWYIDVL